MHPSIPTGNFLGESHTFLQSRRAVGGLGLGDGIKTHTDKWMTGGGTSPMEYIARVKPIEVKGSVAVCYGGVEPALGHEVRQRGLARPARRSARPPIPRGSRFWWPTRYQPHYSDACAQVEYIKVTGRGADNPSACKYCGLRYYQAKGHHGH